MKKSLAIKCVAGIAVLAVTATGCSSSKKTAAPATTGTGSSTAKPKILYIPQAAGNAYFDPIGKGIADQCVTLGCTSETQGPADSQATSQIQIMDAGIQKHVAVIAISPNNDAAMAAEVAKAEAAGILVIAVNSPQTGAQATINPTDFSTIGQSMLDMILSIAGDTGACKTISTLSATQGAPGQTAWIADMKKLAGSGKYSALSLGETQYGNDEAQKSSEVMSAMLTKNDKCINAPTAAGLPAAAQVLSSSPAKKGSTILTGLALPSSMKKFLGDGTVKQFGLWNVPAEGWATAALAMQMLNGKIAKNCAKDTALGFTPPAGSTPSGAQSLTAGASCTFNASEFVVFNKDNIGNYNF